MQDSILFTAFEPSGDAHAAPVIRQLREAAPEVEIYAWGGPKMAEAGATVVETTTSDGAMGLNALGKVLSTRRTIASIRRWSAKYRVLAHVAVDSPAANFPICRIMRKRGARVVHLVAPQLWAWGGWRAGKLRRRTDLVLCLLPFEEEWFGRRRIPARFVGHPRMNRPIDEAALAARARDFPGGSPRIAILPGSRRHEVKANLRLLAAVFGELQARESGTTGLIGAASGEIAALVRERLPVFPTGLHLVTADADAVIAWADLCLAVSGTISLDIARQQTPMIGVYRTSLISALAAKLLLRTRFRLLPNIVAEREIVPEFIPWAGGPGPITAAARGLLVDSKNLVRQSAALAEVCHRYATKRPDVEAARWILRVARGEVVE